MGIRLSRRRMTEGRMPRDEKLIANNKKAYHDYFWTRPSRPGSIDGTEVKSLRANHASLRSPTRASAKGDW